MSLEIKITYDNNFDENQKAAVQRAVETVTCFSKRAIANSLKI